MSRALYLILLIVTLLSPCRLYAQGEDHGQLLEQAEQAYQIGQLERALASLTEHLDALKGNDKMKALRLIALCHFANDDLQQTELYARQLLDLNNYYSNVDDPPRFEEIIKRLKAGQSVRVTTASNVSEGISETPIPITIITAEMIENLGYNKNLNQILAAYVPGMTEVQSDRGDNMAMHGAFANEQELILVMENGHRLNTRSTNGCTMDYSISTEKIDHIEVLRGPASSLYGNVALSAVVNIITKTGSEMNGIKAKYGYGSFGTHKADVTAGMRFVDTDIFAWASIYKSDGQQRSVRDSAEYHKRYFIAPCPNQYAYVDAYKQKPCYDIGATFRHKGWELQLSRKCSKKLPQFGLYGYYDYDRYRLVDNTKPGITTESTHAEAGYTHQFKYLNVSLSLYGDWYDISDYTPLGGEDVENEKQPIDDRDYMYGMFTVTKSHEHTIGGNLRVNTNYKLGNMTGNLLAGSQYETFKMDDIATSSGKDYTTVYFMTEPDTYKNDGHENSLSFYMQDKHYFTKQIIMNAGMRYDIKWRIDKSKEKAWSPRLAFIYVPKESFSTKLMFSKSFVDMSYANRMYGYMMEGINYLPQYLTTVQYSVIGKVTPLHLSCDVNLFYNKFSNLYFKYSTTDNKWANEGKYENFGAEANIVYSHQRLFSMLTLYWCKDIKAESYYYSEEENKVAAIPHVTANLNMAWKLIEQKRHLLKIHGNLQYTGRIIMLNEVYDPKTTTFSDETTSVKGNVYLDLGLKYTFNNRLHLSFDCENVLNTDHFITGPDSSMFPQYKRGRNIMGSIAYTL